MKLDITRTTAIFPYGYMVQWTVADVPPSESGSFRFTLQRSGGPEGPWLTVLDAQDQYGYLDKFNAIEGTLDESQPNQLRLFSEFHYRLTCVAPSGAVMEARQETGPKEPTRYMNNVLRVGQRNFALTLKYNATEMAILKRRRWGTRCKVCTDQTTREQVRAQHKECWGTGIVGGYWTPYYTKARRNTSGNASAITPSGKSDANGALFWLPSSPTLERDDILVSLSDQRRFRVNQEVETQISLQSVHQEVTCVEVLHDNVIYRYPIQRETLNPLY